MIGHTVTGDGRIKPRFDGRVVMIDVGMNPLYGRNLAALEIGPGGALAALYPSRREELLGLPPRRSGAPGDVWRLLGRGRARQRRQQEQRHGARRRRAASWSPADREPEPGHRGARDGARGARRHVRRRAGADRDLARPRRVPWGSTRPGPASATGVISSRGSTNFAHPGWRNFDFRGALEAGWSCPSCTTTTATPPRSTRTTSCSGRSPRSARRSRRSSARASAAASSRRAR